MKKRLVAYAALIVVVVTVSVFILSRERAPIRGGFAFAGGGRSAPTKAWEPSAKLDEQANEGFEVTKKGADATPTAGKSTELDWPQFNGPKRDNKSPETGLLQSWPKEGPELVWSSKGLGIGYSTVAVADGVLYTMGNKGESEAVIALDAGSGEKIWSTPISWASKLSAGDGPRSTPTISGDAVLALGGNGDLACLEKSSGKIRWRKNIMHDFEGGVPGWGVCESVLVDGNKVICTPGGAKGTIVALDINTGEPIWKSVLPQKDGAGYASAAVAEIGGVRQYIQFTARGTVGVSADDGDFLWREDSAANPTANCSSPLIEKNLVFSASSYGQGGALVKVTGSDSSFQAERVYHTSDMKNHHGDMVIVDGLLYGSDDAIFTCLELETGKVKWQNRSVGKGAVTFADGRIYLRSETGPVALIEPSGEGYREKGRFQQPDRSSASAWAHPVVAAGKLFLRDQDLLLCYNVTASQAP
ncbi:MAG: PQQ-binding-like beta-propeller repeat protein [Planctomycetaceae bacterium]